MPVNTPSPEYTAAADKWARIRDCRSGRDAVMKAGTKYLPRLPGAKAVAGREDPYAAYQMRATFYNAVERTVVGLAGFIFQKPPVVEDAKDIENVLQDVTPRGHVPIEQLALEVAQEVLTPGRVGLLVDFPTPAPGVPKESIRPFAAVYKAENIISWRTGDRGADEVLTRVVLRECEEVQDPKDPFVTTEAERYRVCELVSGESGTPTYTQTVWRLRTKMASTDPDAWVADPPVISTRRGVPLDFIPFTFVGPTGVSPDVPRPPLEDLADVNLAHYRNSADIEHGLHLVALPTPWVAGHKSQAADPLPIGPHVVWDLELQGSAGMLEFTGHGLAAIKEAMRDKERQMATLGARLLEQEAAAPETATAVGMRHAGEHATLRTIAGAIEQAVTQVLKWLQWWAGVAATPADSKATFSVNKEFFALKATPDEVRAALLSWQGGGISYETFYERLQKGGWSRDGISAEEERKAIEAEDPMRPEPPEPQKPGDPQMRMPPNPAVA